MNNESSIRKSRILMKARQMLTGASATELAELVKRKSPKKVVLSQSSKELKFLEEISEGDYIIHPRARFPRREVRKLRVLTFLRYGIDDAIYIPIGILGFSLFGGGIAFFTFPEGMSRIDSLPPMLAGASLLSLLFSPLVFKKLFKGFFKKYGFIRFPKLKRGELKNSNLTHEQVYEIASLGQSKD